jgi:hypothetical protein
LHNSFGQRVSLAPIEFVSALATYENSVYCCGQTYLEDGNTSFTTFNKYDLDLNLQWSMRIDTTLKNEFNGLSFRNDTIFLTGRHGTWFDGGLMERKIDDDHQYLYLISTGGKLLKKIYLGRVFSPTSGILVHGNHVYITYTNVTGTHFSNVKQMPSMRTIYNLQTGEIEQHAGKPDVGFVSQIIETQSGIIAVGSCHDTFEQYRKNDPYEEYLVKFLTADSVVEKSTVKTHHTFAAVPKTKEIAVFSAHNSTKKDSSTYIRLNYYDTETLEFKRHIIVQDTSWSYLDPKNTYITDSCIWMLIGKKGHGYYTAIDLDGHIVSKLPFDLDPLLGYPEEYLILTDRQIQVIHFEKFGPDENPDLVVVRDNCFPTTVSRKTNKKNMLRKE